jgi:peptidoglycan/LPS O-acetylase OafA/YrhL
MPPRIPELDGLRGLACLSVVLFHYVFLLVPATASAAARHVARVFTLGWAGVDLFFVLSGFLLGGLLIDHRTSRQLFRAFYARRCFRIFPLYVAWLGLFLLLRHLPGWPPGLFDDSMPWWAYVAYVQNIFDAMNGHWGAYWMTITWSLAIEEQFYLILPALIVFTPPRPLPGVLVLLVISAGVLRYWLSLILPAHGLATYTLLPCRWDGLFLGVLGAWAVRQEPLSRFLQTDGWFLRLALVEFSLVGLALLYRAPAHNSIPAREFGYTLIACGCLTLLLLAIYDPWASRVFRFAPLTALGAISYGVYVIHPAANWLMHWWARGELPRITSWSEAALTAAAFGLTLLVATLSYRFLETPMLRIGHRWRY